MTLCQEARLDIVFEAGSGLNTWGDCKTEIGDHEKMCVPTHKPVRRSRTWSTKTYKTKTKTNTRNTTCKLGRKTTRSILVLVSYE